MSSYQNVYPVMGYSDNPMVENLGPLGLVLKTAVIPDFTAGTPVNAVAASAVLTSDATAPSNNDTVTVGTKVYTFKTALSEAYAEGTLTSDATAPSNNDTVTIGGQTYTFKTALTSASAENEVLIGVSAAVALDNLKSAINKTAGGGTTYGSDTLENSYVTATTNTDTTQLVVAKALGTDGNAIATTETSSHLSWGGAVLAGGVDSVANEVLIGVSAAVALDNLKSAVNGTAGAGTTYSTATEAHTLVDATTNTNTEQTFEAKTKGTAGNSIAKAESSSHLDFDGVGAVFTGGVAGTVAGQFACYVDGSYLWIAVADNTATTANFKKIAWS